MERINLHVDARNIDDNVKSLRVNGFIPAVIYGKNTDSLRIVLNYKDFLKTFAGHSISSFVNVESKEETLNGKIAVIKEIQKDPVTESIIHIDFHEISMHEKVEIEAAIHFTGKPEGVKLGGILEPLIRHILIKGYPKDIIDTIDIDVSALKIGDIIHAKDLKLGEGIEVLTEKDAPVVVIAEPTVEDTAVTAETEEASETP